MILFISAALITMLAMPAHRQEVLATALLSVLIVCLGLLNARRKRRIEAGIPASA